MTIDSIAQLMVAAPSLLKACETALATFQLQRDCHCDETSEGQFACYFHRIEGDLRRAVAKAKGEP